MQQRALFMLFSQLRKRKKNGNHSGKKVKATEMERARKPGMKAGTKDSVAHKGNKNQR